MIVVLILGALAAIAIPRIMGGSAAAKANGCKTNIDTLNCQIELYYANNGAYPADLTAVSTNVAYFPDEVPTCPMTGAAYPATLVNNRVDDSGHSH